jgi:hypothetical protein
MSTALGYEFDYGPYNYVVVGAINLTRVSRHFGADESGHVVSALTYRRYVSSAQRQIGAMANDISAH